MGRRKKTSSRSLSESEVKTTPPSTRILPLPTENSILSKHQFDYFLDNPDIFEQIFADNTPGSTIIHMVCKEGHAGLLCELLELHPNLSSIDSPDIESRFSPLHDALYYGNINCAVKLVQRGASLETRDIDGFTPLDLAIWSQFKNGFVPQSSNFNVTTWGGNTNYNLGHNHDRSLKIPEKIKFFNRNKFKASICNVNFGKYHTLFLDTAGFVYSCGYGMGGRLGLGSEDTLLEPQKIPDLKNIVKISCSNDHSLALSKEGLVYSWGINNHKVLGHPDIRNVLKPQLIRALSGTEGFTTVKAAKFHSVLVTEDQIFTFGFNGGQLGHMYSEEPYQITPRSVTRLRHIHGSHVVKIAHVHASAAATVIGFENGIICICNQYEVRKVACLNVAYVSNISINQGVKTKKIRVTGGSLARQVRENTNRPTKNLLIAILDTNGLVSCCCPGWFNKALVYNWNVYTNKFIVSDISLGSGCLMLLTTDGEVFTCDPYPTLKTEKEIKRDHSLKTWSWYRKKENIQMTRPIKLSKQVGLHNGMKVVCNGTGDVRACIVQDRCSTIDYVPRIEPSRFSSDLAALLDNDEVYEADLIVYCKSDQSFPAHKAILANASKKLYGLVHKAQEDTLLYIQLSGQNCSEDYVRCMLQYAYLAQELPKFKDSKQYPLLHNGLIDPAKCSKIDRNRIMEFSDVVLVSNDGTEFKCHRCILAARCDYFMHHFMVNSRWGNAQSNDKIHIDTTQHILGTFIYYIYTDLFPKNCSFDSLKLLLGLSDEYLTSRLKSFCETELAAFITEENLLHILRTANDYNAQQLKVVCLHIIAMNIPFYLENRALECLEEELLEQLDMVYKEVVLFHMNHPENTDYSIKEFLDSIPNPHHHAENGGIITEVEKQDTLDILGLPTVLDFYYVSEEEDEDVIAPDVELNPEQVEPSPDLDLNMPPSDHHESPSSTLNEPNINKKMSDDPLQFVNVGKKRHKQKHQTNLAAAQMTTASSPPKTPQSPPKTPKSPVKQPSQAWGSPALETSTSPTKSNIVSLTEIMTLEKSMKQNSRPKKTISTEIANQLLFTSPPSPRKASSPTKCTSPRKPSSSPWGTPVSPSPISSLMDIMREDASSSKPPKQVQTLSPKQPARSKCKSSETFDFNPNHEVYSLKAIMEAEEATKQKTADSHHYTRSLDVIQIEEKALQELEVLYKVKESADEFIVIRTVPKLEIGKPVWGKHL